jgi:hypothetical protein
MVKNGKTGSEAKGFWLLGRSQLGHLLAAGTQGKRQSLQQTQNTSETLKTQDSDLR